MAALNQHEDLASPELAEAWQNLQLHWLRSIPSYRQQVQERVLRAHAERDEAFGRGHCMECGGVFDPERYTKGCAHCTDRRRKYQKSNGDVNLLNREVEGCG
jgi:hypothetical protein